MSDLVKGMVSILIPTYNRLNHTIEAVESAVNQTYVNFEIIIVDNFSTDGTYQTLKERYKGEKKIKIYQNKKNLGPVRNWIECSKHIHGEYTKIIWSDDLICPTYLEKTVSILEKNEEVAFVYSHGKKFSTKKVSSGPVNEDNLEILSEDSEVDFGKNIIGTQRLYYDMVWGVYRKHICYVSPICALFRTDSFIINENIESHCGYDFLGTGAGTDLMIFLDALQFRKKFAYLAETLFYYRVHAGSITVDNLENVMLGYFCAKIYFNENYLQNKKYARYCTFSIINMQLKKRKNPTKYIEKVQGVSPSFLYMLKQYFLFGKTLCEIAGKKIAYSLIN